MSYIMQLPSACISWSSQQHVLTQMTSVSFRHAPDITNCMLYIANKQCCWELPQFKLLKFVLYWYREYILQHLLWKLCHVLYNCEIYSMTQNYPIPHCLVFFSVTKRKGVYFCYRIVMIGKSRMTQNQATTEGARTQRGQINVK